LCVAGAWATGYPFPSRAENTFGVRLAIPLRGAVVVVVLLGVAVVAGLDTGDPSCGVAELDPVADATAELTPATVVESAPTAAGTRLVTDGADPDPDPDPDADAPVAAAAVRDSTLDAPKIGSSSS
jgi:hypothetical protein